MITDAQFQAWLRDPASVHCLLVEAEWVSVDDRIGAGVNVALATNGAVASASSEHSSGSYPAVYVNNAERNGATYWQDNTAGTFPDWVQVALPAKRLIDRVVVYSAQDNISSPGIPTDTLTGSLYVLEDFDVLAWDGSAWVTLATVRGNDLIKRTVTFDAFVAKIVRIVVLATGDGASRMVELEVYTPASSSGTEYLATHPFVSRPTDTPANQRYRAIVTDVPELAQTMSEVFVGHTVPNVGTVKIAAVDARTDYWIFDRDWLGRPARLYVGDQSWARSDFRPVWIGVTANLQVEGTNGITIELRDRQHLLNQPLKREAVESGNLAGAPAPVILGTVYNAPCIPIDETARLFRLADGPIASIIQVRNNGANFTTYTANLSEGTITLTSGTGSGLTADFVGPTVGTLSMTNAADMVRYLVTSRGYFTDDDLDLVSFARLRDLCTAPLAMYVPTSEVNVYQVVDEVMSTIGGFSAVNREGKLFVGRVDLDGQPVMEITPERIVAHGIAIKRVIQPVEYIRLGARQNNTTHVATTSSVIEGDAIKYRMSHLQSGQAGNPDAGGRLKMRRLPNPEPPVVVTTPDPGLIPTLFLNGGDAAVEAERRMAIWGVRRVVLGIQCFVTAMRLNLGDTVRVTHPRFNLARGRNGVVVGLRERLSARRVEMDVLV